MDGICIDSMLPSLFPDVAVKVAQRPTEEANDSKCKLHILCFHDNTSAECSTVQAPATALVQVRSDVRELPLLQLRLPEDGIRVAEPVFHPSILLHVI